MNLHPEIAKLLSACEEKNSISILEKQQILNKALELNNDLVYVVSELEKIEQNTKKNSTDINKCKSCGELIPALDRVCPSCKNVKSSSGSIDVKLDDLIFESENLLSELKSSDKILLSKNLLKNSSFSFPIFIGASFVFGWNFNSDVLAGVFFCSLLIWLLIIRRLKRNIHKNDQLQITKSFQVLKSQIEQKIRLLELYFGNDNRTNSHINKIKQELQTTTKVKDQLLIYEILIYIIASIALCITGYFTAI
jgi:hypothetical protein